jgi:membrane-associated phospholipid phosphatase
LRGAAFWTVLALNFGDPRLTAGCLAVIALAAWSRVRLRRHHLSDVVVGVLLGLVLGWLVHRR